MHAKLRRGDSAAWVLQDDEDDVDRWESQERRDGEWVGGEPPFHSCLAKDPPFTQTSSRGGHTGSGARLLSSKVAGGEQAPKFQNWGGCSPNCACAAPSLPARAGPPAHARVVLRMRTTTFGGGWAMAAAEDAETPAPWRRRRLSSPSCHAARPLSLRLPQTRLSLLPARHYRASVRRRSPPHVQLRASLPPLPPPLPPLPPPPSRETLAAASPAPEARSSQSAPCFFLSPANQLRAPASNRSATCAQRRGTSAGASPALEAR